MKATRILLWVSVTATAACLALVARSLSYAAAPAVQRGGDRGFAVRIDATWIATKCQAFLDTGVDRANAVEIEGHKLLRSSTWPETLDSNGKFVGAVEYQGSVKSSYYPQLGLNGKACIFFVRVPTGTKGAGHVAFLHVVGRSAPVQLKAFHCLEPKKHPEDVKARIEPYPPCRQAQGINIDEEGNWELATVPAPPGVAALSDSVIVSMLPLLADKGVWFPCEPSGCCRGDT